MSWLLNLTEDAAVGEHGRSFVFLKKDVYKKEGYCEVQSTQTSQPAEVVSAVMLALDGWHFLSLSLSLSADGRNEKMLQSETTAAPRQRCYHRRQHQRAPQVEDSLYQVEHSLYLKVKKSSRPSLPRLFISPLVKRQLKLKMERDL